MTDTNYLKMISDFWETTGKSTSEVQKDLFQQMLARFGVTSPFAAFPTNLATSNKASEAFRELLNSLMAVPNALASAASQSNLSDKKTAELLQKIMNPQEWLSATGYTNQSIRQLVEGPKFADIGQLEGKVRCADRRLDGPSCASARAKHVATHRRGPKRRRNLRQNFAKWPKTNHSNPERK